MTGNTRVALFDLDHTLLAVDSDHAWGEFTVALGWSDAGEFRRRNDAFYDQYRAGTLDIHDYVRFATQALRGRDADEQAAAHRRFMGEVVEPALLPVARALVEQHRAAGDLLAIVTATNEFVTRPIAQALGVEELIAVELERDGDGRYTGAIRGVPSSREGKVARVRDWLAAQGLRWEDCEITFYSDSVNDLPLLERVAHPVATNPDDSLRALARERGWRILDLFTKK